LVFVILTLAIHFNGALSGTSTFLVTLVMLLLGTSFGTNAGRIGVSEVLSEDCVGCEEDIVTLWPLEKLRFIPAVELITVVVELFVLAVVLVTPAVVELVTVELFELVVVLVTPAELLVMPLAAAAAAAAAAVAVAAAIGFGINNAAACCAAPTPVLVAAVVVIVWGTIFCIILSTSGRKFEPVGGGR